MRLLATVLALLIAAAVNATVVDVTPGSLGHGVTIDPAVTDLTLRGEMDGSDLQYIATRLRELKRLDLSGVRIAAYNGRERLAANMRTHAADILPPYSLAGVPAAEILLPSTITAIGDGALMSSGITSIAIPGTVTSIGNGAFANCKVLVTLSIPAAVTEAGSHLCKECTALTNLTFAAATVPPDAFNGCTALAEVKFSKALEEIGDNAFYATAIATLDLSECGSLRVMGARAFADCLHLTSVTLPDGVSTMGDGVFFGDTKLANVKLPGALTRLPDMALTGTRLSAEDGELLPDGLESIGTLALAHNTEAKTVKFPASLSEIGDYAFEGWTALDSIDASALRNIPELGENVWLAVEQPNVVLTVHGDILDDYKEAPQWKEFNIVGDFGDTSGVDDIISEEEGKILARFEGMTLHVIAGSGVTSASLYDMAGVRLAALSPGGSTELSIDTSPWQTRLYILTLTLAPDDKRVALKIIR